MPELPEVETAKRGIEPHLLGRTITGVVVRNPKLRWPVPENLPELLSGQTVQRVERRAKYILVSVAGGKVAGQLLIHLGMTGNVRILPQDEAPQKHDHVDILLSDGKLLRYVDPRRFGTMLWVLEGKPHKLLENLGPEPLTGLFTGEHLYKLSRKRKGAVKNFIMNNAIVVGVGNIYASEALFAAGIRPNTPAGRVSKARYELLSQEIKKVLGRAIEAGGTTLKDFVTADGSPGYFRIALQVYGRAGEPCLTCGSTIHSKVIGQRNSFFCSECQK